MSATLDLETALIFLMAFTAMEFLIALVIWNAHRQIKGLAMTAAGLAFFCIAVWMVPLAASIPGTIRNIFFNLSQAMAAVGMSNFLEHPRLPWLPWATAGLTLVIWPIIHLTLPETQGAPIRSIVSSIFSLLMIGRMMWLMGRDHSQTRLLKTLTLACLITLLVTVSARLYDLLSSPWSAPQLYSVHQSWFYFLLSLEVNFLFFCLLTMVGERLSRDLRVRNAELAEERTTQQRFMSMLGHELKTPLSVIRMSLDANDVREAAKKRALQAANDIDHVVDCCLNVDRLEHGRLDLQSETISLIEIVNDIQYGISQPERICVAIEGAGRCQANRVIVATILRNLVDNALKYGSPQHEVQLLILNQSQGDRAGLAVRVINAIGPSGPPDPKRLFEKYYRSPKALTKTGSGLGLFIAYHFAQALGGQLTHISMDGHVCFEMWMPS